MIGTALRRRIKLLLGQGHSQAEVARRSGVSLRSVKRIAREAGPFGQDDAAERRRRRIGRPSVVQDFKKLVGELLSANPGIKGVEVFRRARFMGYAGSRSAMYALIAELRTRRPQDPKQGTRRPPAEAPALESVRREEELRSIR